MRPSRMSEGVTSQSRMRRSARSKGGQPGSPVAAKVVQAARIRSDSGPDSGDGGEPTNRAAYRVSPVPKTSGMSMP